MKTGDHKGIPVYGPRPSAAAMLARAKRDGFEVADLRPAVIAVGRFDLAAGDNVPRYWVEGWVRPDPYNERQAVTYTMRRDGNVLRGWAGLERVEILPVLA